MEEPIQLVSTGRNGNTFVLERKALEVLEQEKRFDFKLGLGSLSGKYEILDRMLFPGTTFYR